MTGGFGSNDRRISMTGGFQRQQQEDSNGSNDWRIPTTGGFQRQEDSNDWRIPTTTTGGF